MKAVLLCIWTSPVSVRRAGHAQWRQELLKTLRLCDFKARSFFSCPSTQKRCLLCCEALMLNWTLLQILDIPITERIKRIRKASYLPSPPHRGSHLRPNFFGEGDWSSSTPFHLHKVSLSEDSLKLLNQMKCRRGILFSACSMHVHINTLIHYYVHWDLLSHLNLGYRVLKTRAQS